MRIPLTTPLFGIHGMGPGFVKRLETLGIKTVRDLLWHFPARYEDFSKIYKIGELEPGQHATIQGVIEDVSVRKTWKKQITIVEAMIADESGTIRAVWFNQPYLATSLKPGRLANFAGKTSVSDEGEIYLNHPAHEILSQKKQETRHTARLVPIYPETKGLTSKGLRFLVQPIIKNVELVAEWIPQEVLAKFRLPEINLALNDIHFPKAIEDAAVAKKRFGFEDLFLLQLYNLQQKLKLKEQKAPALATDIEWLKAVIEKLPYELTLSQKKSLWEMVKDVEHPRPMNRLLQGDVGSGKTVVAALVAIIAAKNGLQTAFMAPTEVLARQHFETLKKLFGGVARDVQPITALITSSDAKLFRETDTVADVKKEELNQKIKDGEIRIVIGTHALIQESVRFKNLAFVIVDEQHRFGVKQRAALAQQDGKNILLPHFLSMSATPIPRTLMMTVFGDLDISLITELPAGRKNIITEIVPPKGRSRSYEFIRSEVQKGRQVFVICPRIEVAGKEPAAKGADQPSLISQKQSALWDVKSVKEEYEKLSKKIFPDLKVAMLHGKLKPKEKEATMKQFSSGAVNILVSTSVIEVGVDIPNATIMMIEGADRFGLAQLYQFRGRVGRSEHQSYCLLFTDSDSQSTKERLKALLEAKNGFELAEYDLKLRGPGELLGEGQAGMPDLAMQALQDPVLVKTSREAALAILESDPKLKNSPPLKEKLSEFEKALHLE
ncbi:MAG: ATP-dependent DNA helicase RecG [Patescibacteria group bacterium]